MSHSTVREHRPESMLLSFSSRKVLAEMVSLLLLKEGCGGDAGLVWRRRWTRCGGTNSANIDGSSTIKHTHTHRERGKKQKYFAMTAARKTGFGSSCLLDILCYRQIRFQPRWSLTSHTFPALHVVVVVPFASLPVTSLTLAMPETTRARNMIKP